MGLVDVASVEYLCKEFCKFAALRAELCLELKQSEVAAAALTLALNVLTSVHLCQLLNFEPLRPKTKGVLSVWSEDIVGYCHLDMVTLATNYRKMLTLLDTHILNGQLSQDKSIWL
jgi:hypothetical protein